MNRYVNFTRNCLFLFLLFLIGGCREVISEKLSSKNNYFDLKGLLETQILLLDSLQPQVNKVTLIDGDMETQILHLDSAGWAREMEIFFEADINEPILKDAYELEEKNVGDSLTLMSYEAIDKKNAEIEFLKVFYPKNGDLPSHIKAVFTEKNALYDSRRSLELNFKLDNDLHVLSGYSIEGIQKMLLKDTIYYKVKVKDLF